MKPIYLSVQADEPIDLTDGQEYFADFYCGTVDFKEGDYQRIEANLDTEVRKALAQRPGNHKMNITSVDFLDYQYNSVKSQYSRYNPPIIIRVYFVPTGSLQSFLISVLLVSLTFLVASFAAGKSLEFLGIGSKALGEGIEAGFKGLFGGFADPKSIIGIVIVLGVAFIVIFYLLPKARTS